jgi:hypothetical protein
MKEDHRHGHEEAEPGLGVSRVTYMELWRAIGVNSLISIKKTVRRQ